IAMPRPAVSQIVEAVVIPRMVNPSLKIVPEPIKPTPTNIYDAMRSGLEVPPILIDMIVNKVEPTQISMSVRNPAGLDLYSLSKPTKPPITTAIKILIRSAEVISMKNNLPDVSFHRTD